MISVSVRHSCDFCGNTSHSECRDIPPGWMMVGAKLACDYHAVVVYPREAKIVEVPA